MSPEQRLPTQPAEAIPAALAEDTGIPSEVVPFLSQTAALVNEACEQYMLVEAPIDRQQSCLGPVVEQQAETHSVLLSEVHSSPLFPVQSYGEVATPRDVHPGEAIFGERQLKAPLIVAFIRRDHRGDGGKAARQAAKQYQQGLQLFTKGQTKEERKEGKKLMAEADATINSLQGKPDLSETMSDAFYNWLTGNSSEE